MVVSFLHVWSEPIRRYFILFCVQLVVKQLLKPRFRKRVRTNNMFDLPDVLPFMRSQPPRIEQHRPFENLSPPVTVAVRDQPSGGNGSRKANNSARCEVKARNEGRNSSS